MKRNNILHNPIVHKESTIYKLSGKNSGKEPEPPRFRRTNTYVHTNVDSICYMYSILH